jgi:hypothetical protein
MGAKLRLMLTAVCATCLLVSVAYAQCTTLGCMEDAAITQCTAGQLPGAKSTSPRFCACWVHRWVELWNDDDFATWHRGVGATTPHMHEMESVAANQCGG